MFFNGSTFPGLTFGGDSATFGGGKAHRREHPLLPAAPVPLSPRRLVPGSRLRRGLCNLQRLVPGAAGFLARVSGRSRGRTSASIAMRVYIHYELTEPEFTLPVTLEAGDSRTVSDLKTQFLAAYATK